MRKITISLGVAIAVVIGFLLGQFLTEETDRPAVAAPKVIKATEIPRIGVPPSEPFLVHMTEREWERTIQGLDIGMKPSTIEAVQVVTMPRPDGPLVGITCAVGCQPFCPEVFGGGLVCSCSCLSPEELQDMRDRIMEEKLRTEERPPVGECGLNYSEHGLLMCGGGCGPDSKCALLFRPGGARCECVSALRLTVPVQRK